jgi:hypothetical protein
VSTVGIECPKAVTRLDGKFEVPARAGGETGGLDLVAPSNTLESPQEEPDLYPYLRLDTGGEKVQGRLLNPEGFLH